MEFESLESLKIQRKGLSKRSPFRFHRASRLATEVDAEKNSMLLKRRKLNDDARDVEPGEQNDLICRAKDLIRLIFIHDHQTMHEIRPTFTHQLFENETISFITNLDTKVEIIIQCSNLAHTVRLIGCNTLEKELLIQGLKLAIPNESEYQHIENHCTESIKDLRYLEHSNIPSCKFLYQFFTNDNNEVFEIHLANSKDYGVTEMLRRCEKVAMWFIETADSVDFEDDRWELLICYQVMTKDQPNKQQYNIAGYMTLFTFNNPFMGAKIRVCQALVLPYHQGKNIGKFMLKEIYKLAQNRDAVVEVTIEDPAPGFQRLRDCVDCEWFIDYINVNKSINHQLLEAEDIAKNLKITKLQGQFINEAFRYASFVPSGIIFPVKRINESQGIIIII